MDLQYLDRQKVECAAGEVLLGFQVVREGCGGNQMRYKYQCAQLAVVHEPSLQWVLNRVGEHSFNIQNVKTKEYLRIAEKGGSDVRLELGVPFRPGAWPRAGAKTQYWSWAVVHGYPWINTTNVHINKLELLAVFNALKWRTRLTDQQCCRFLHMVDSQVVGAILTKGRTSSNLLRPTIRRVSALILAAQLYPAYIFVASEDNPADILSRWAFVHNKRRMQKGPPVERGVLDQL